MAAFVAAQPLASALGRAVAIAPAAGAGARPAAAAPGTPLGGAAAAAVIAAGAAGLAPRRRQNRVARCAFQSLLRKPRKLTSKDCVPEEMQNSEYAKEIMTVFDLMANCMHVMNMSVLVMEQKKDKSAVGLYGADVEEWYMRKKKGGVTTIAHASVMACVCKRLLEDFPEDVILCEEDSNSMEKHPDFCEIVTNFLLDYDMAPDATPEKTAAWVSHANSYVTKAAVDEELPSRYWALTPVCTTEDFLNEKVFGMSLALIVDKEVVVSGLLAPSIDFDHASRTAPSGTGSPFFFAAKGLGAYTQLMMTEREQGVYKGKSIVRGLPIKLDVSEKVKRIKNDDLYDALNTKQLRVAINARLREDIFQDCERTGKNLGSDYCKFDQANSSVKYAWLARGNVDNVWYLASGLYNKGGEEKTTHHAAGVLIAQESGAKISDLDGKDLDWCGPVLLNNRGIMATDPGVVPLQGLIDAMGLATETSNERYQERVERRKEMKMFLANLFKNLSEVAETPEDKAGALLVQARGKKMLEDESDESELDTITREDMHRDAPILGESTLSDDTFDTDTLGDIPYSPISMD